jgi:hypothetical protein
MFRNYKIYFITFVFLILHGFSCKKELIPEDTGNAGPKGPFAVEIGDSKIPYLVIDTKKNQIQNEPKIPAVLSLFEGKTLVKKQNIGIEYKGKTSYRLSNKKSFSIETWDEAGADIKTSFFGFPEEEDWILTANVVNTRDRFIIDKSMLYHHIAYELSRSIGRYASRTKLVEVELNGEYLGVYTFMEKLKHDKNRIDIDDLNPTSANISGGYIISIDKASTGKEAIGKPLSYFDNNWEDDAKYTAQNSFRSNYDINRNAISFEPFRPPYHPNKFLETYFLYEYPDQYEITVDQKKYIQNYINNFETALINDDFTVGERTYEKFIDIPSFIDFFLLNELCRNIDAFRLSTYLQKQKDGKLAMGPIWDMNIGFDEGDRIPINEWVINYNKVVQGDPWSMVFWWPRFLEDPIFKAEVKKRWLALRANEFSNTKLTELVDLNVKYLKENGAISRNYKKWDQNIGVDYDLSIVRLNSFLKMRATWMDETIGSF